MIFYGFLFCIGILSSSLTLNDLTGEICGAHPPWPCLSLVHALCETCSATPDSLTGGLRVHRCTLARDRPPIGAGNAHVWCLVSEMRLQASVGAAHAQMRHFRSRPEVTRPQGTLMDAGLALPGHSGLACHGVWTCLRLDGGGKCQGALLEICYDLRDPSFNLPDIYIYN